MIPDLNTALTWLTDLTHTVGSQVQSVLPLYDICATVLSCEIFVALNSTLWIEKSVWNGSVPQLARIGKTKTVTIVSQGWAQASGVYRSLCSEWLGSEPSQPPSLSLVGIYHQSQQQSQRADDLKKKICKHLSEQQETQYLRTMYRSFNHQGLHDKKSFMNTSIFSSTICSLVY